MSYEPIMKVLFITQAIDEGDPVLGFVVGWVRAFARAFPLRVLCLRKGRGDFPGVPVRSLGKERGGNALLYALRFFFFIIRDRKEYDTVFVHMNPEYVILGGILWRLMGKRIALWYNHTKGGVRLWLAMRLAHVVFHTSPYAASAVSRKSRRYPAGIDTTFFVSAEGVRKPRSILFLGRIAPLKNIDVLVRAVLLLHSRGKDFSLTIVGSAFPGDEKYERELKELAKPLVWEGKVTFVAGVSNRDALHLFQSADIFVNLTPAGNYDKTVLEAFACETPVVASSPAFYDILPPEFRFKEKDPATLADTLLRVLSLPEDERREWGRKFRKYAVERHDLAILVDEIRGKLS